MITDDERYNAVTAEWRAAREKLEKRLIDNQDPKNPIVIAGEPIQGPFASN